MRSSDSGPIRVVRVITRLNIGGPAIQAIDLSSRLTALGFDTLLVHGRLAAGEGDMSDGLNFAAPQAVHHLHALQREIAPLADAAAVRRVYGLLREFRPAIVHTHTAKAGAVGRLATWAYNRTAGRRARARVVHTYHGHVLEGYFNPVKTAAFVAAERTLASITDRIVTVSARVRDDIAGRYRIGREAQHRVIPLGFDLDRFAAIGPAERTAARSALQIPRDAPVVSTVGRLTAVKNHQLFLETARLVARRHPSAIFLIAGDGELRQPLTDAARSLGLVPHVRFLGWRRDLAGIYAASDVFLLTSRNEGTPVALIESMASGCAGVATDVGGVRDVIESPDMGRVVSNGPSDLAAAVLELVDDCALRARVGQQGRASVTARFTLRRLLDDVSALYHELLESAPADPPEARPAR